MEIHRAGRKGSRIALLFLPQLLSGGGEFALLPAGQRRILRIQFLDRRRDNVRDHGASDPFMVGRHDIPWRPFGAGDRQGRRRTTVSDSAALPRFSRTPAGFYAPLILVAAMFYALPFYGF